MPSDRPSSDHSPKPVQTDTVASTIGGLTSSSSSSQRVYAARWVVPVSSPVIENGAVLTSGARIECVGPRAEVLAQAQASGGAELVDLPGCAVLPGLVNAHTHLDLSLFRGLCEESGFFAWIRHLTALKYSEVASETFETAARWGLIEAIRSGITTVGDASDHAAIFGALEESGVRGVTFQEVFGPHPRDAVRSLEALTERLDPLLRRQSSRVRVGVSPHAPYTVSTELFARVARLATSMSLPVSIHVAESQAERAFVRDGAGPFADDHRRREIPVTARRVSPVRLLEDCGILETAPLLVHAVDVDASDVGLIASRGAKVVHCPKSNAKFAHGIAPLSQLLAAGVEIALGTDGTVSNNSCDLFDEARVAFLLARAQEGQHGGELTASGTHHARRVDAPRLLELATIGGARALGLADEIGTLEPGKRADLIALDLSGVRQEPVYDPLVSMLFCASGRDVQLTVVDGKVLYDGAAVVTLDEESIGRDVSRCAGAFARWQRERPLDSSSS